MATSTNPHPLANPFNDRPYGNYRPGYGNPIRQGGINRDRLTVPNQDIPLNGSPEWYQMQERNRLEVPNQDIPLGDQLAGSGFIPGSDNIFRLSDGTVVDFKSRKILHTPNDETREYWDDPTRSITMDGDGVLPQTNGCSRDVSIDELINNMDRYRGTAMPDGSLLEPIDPKSAAYWLRAEEEAAALVSGMSDEQKAMIRDFERHFPKSRLIEESQH